MKTFSFSKISAYDKCSRLYFYRYVSDNPPIAYSDTDALDLGTLVHLGLERALTAAATISDSDEIIAIAIDAVNEDSRFDSELRTKAADMIYDYLPELHFGTSTKPYIYNGKPATELVFSVPLTGDINFNGIIDAIITTEDGRNILVDWKTRSRLYTDSAIFIDSQLFLYVFAALKLGIPLHGAAQVQMSSNPPGNLKFNKDGSLSRSMATTTEVKFIEQLMDNSLEPVIPLEFSDKIRPMSDFMRITPIDINERIIADRVDTMRNKIETILSDKLYLRAYNGYTCGYCQYLEHCANAVK